MPDCGKCYETKSDRQFYKRSDDGAVYGICKECHRAYQKERTKKFPDYARIRYLRKYGLTLKEYKKMALNQDGKCAMCFSTQKRALSVDHHHTSGKVRALLCGSCNALLGLAKEKKIILEAAIRYLDKHKNAG